MEALNRIARELRLNRLLTGAEKPVDVLFDYSVKLLRQERYHEALEILEDALLYADAPEIHNNIAYASSRLHDYDRAIDHYRESLKLRPNHPSTLHDLSLELLRVGQYTEGWKLFEYRNIFNTGFSDRYVKGRLPRWQGQDLAGKKIFVSKEQGFGDAIQFCRYIDALLDKAAHIYWLCEPALIKLLAQSFNPQDVTFVDNFETLPECDYWIYQMSLPMYFGNTSAHPYLKSLPIDRIMPTGIKVGLAWKGNYKHANDANRSMKLCQFDQFPITAEYISLQKLNDDPDEISRSKLNIVDIGSGLGDFDETASVIDQLDLVIAVDTAIAHLAGALGKPCWVILPYYGSDWRWGRYGGQTDLYENMKLYWQPAPKTMPTNLIQDLTEFLANKR
jgi:Tetratricopeptide repeat/Glycosyltransferase family 9 (heptosyltransferase)